jgi:hypothetical protein
VKVDNDFFFYIIGQCCAHSLRFNEASCHYMHHFYHSSILNYILAMWASHFFLLSAPLIVLMSSFDRYVARQEGIRRG